MKIYETLTLLSPDGAGRDGADAVNHVRRLIEKCGGELIRVEKYADQKLAYEIKPHRRGVYVLAAFRMKPEDVGALTRTFQLDDKVIRDIVLDRAGTKLEKFFRHYERSEAHEQEVADARSN